MFFNELMCYYTYLKLQTLISLKFVSEIGYESFQRLNWSSTADTAVHLQIKFKYVSLST